MIHIFFSVHLTIYRSAKSQPSSLRLELITCSIFWTSPVWKSLSSLLISLSTEHPQTRQSHCSFWPDIQGKLKKYSNKSTYLFFKMDTVENNFYSKTWTIYISIQYIFKHDRDMLQGNFLSWLNHQLFCLLKRLN